MWGLAKAFLSYAPYYEILISIHVSFIFCDKIGIGVNSLQSVIALVLLCFHLFGGLAHMVIWSCWLDSFKKKDSEHINEKKVKENEGDSKIIVSVLELVKMGKSLY